MKTNNIIQQSATVLCLLMILTGFNSCKIQEEVFPNDPTLEDIAENATLSDLKNVVSGIESGMRNRLGTYHDGVGVIGREFYRFSGSDPRFTSDLLGKGASTLDNNTFYTVNPFYERYRVIRNANILLTAISNTKAPITEEEKNGFTGFAKTIIAHQLLMNLTMQYQNGVRVDVADPDNLGPFLSYDASLAAIFDLLQEGATDLEAAGDAFAFELSSGFAGFDTPSGFNTLNSALAARVALYQGDYNASLAALATSFLDVSGDMTTGAYHYFSAAGGDIINPLYLAPNSTGELRVAHPSFVTDAESGDARLFKVLMRLDTAFQDDLSSTYDVFVYTSLDAPISLIRNEELVLIFAEANAKMGNSGEAIAAIDAIRANAGLGPYTGGATEAELIDEILHQRRYSLFGEGHRWIDMRRNNKLSELPLDRPDDNVWEQFPRPQAEEGT